MSNEDNGNAACGNVLHDTEQLSSFAFGQNGCGFIEHKQLDPRFIDFTGNLNELHVSNRKTAHQCKFVNPHADIIQRLSCVSGHGLDIQKLKVLAKNLADSPWFCNFSVQLDIVRNGKAGNQHEFLMHHADALLHGIHWGHNTDTFSIQKNLALKAAGRMNHRHAKQHVHQGGFSGSVFTQKRVDLTGTNTECYILQHCVTAVFFGNAVHFENVFRRQGVPSFKQERAARYTVRTPDGLSFECQFPDQSPR